MTRQVSRDASDVHFDLPFEIEPGHLAWNPTAVSPGFEDSIIAAAFEFLATQRILDPDKARLLGRHVGALADKGHVAEFLTALSHFGIGKLNLESETNGRYVFRGVGLKGANQTRAPVCGLALGFVEGIVRAVSGKDALGAEVECRSHGHDACVFVVIAK